MVGVRHRIMRSTGGVETAAQQGSPKSVADQQMIGKAGRVTGTIAPGHVGEVMVTVRGGTEHFHAYAVDGDDTIRAGTTVVVVEYFPPRSVVVAPL
jgi:membrane protein implicated in regulation of membrane protease activity